MRARIELEALKINLDRRWRDIAHDLQMRPGNLSAVLCGHRPMTELIARRLGEYFRIDWQMLMDE
jgi:plasmid maintenance system antidote protein VapI